MAPILHLDGRSFRQAIAAGADWVRHTREQFNRNNVFPVAAGDTGTNMALSLSATASAVRAVDEPHLGAVSRLPAEASILGAKGNGGVMARWFLALADALVKSELRQRERLRLGLVEMGKYGASTALERAQNELTQSFDVVELIREPATGVVGAHLGPGAWGSSTSASGTTTPWPDRTLSPTPPIPRLIKNFPLRKVQT